MSGSFRKHDHTDFAIRTRAVLMAHNQRLPRRLRAGGRRQRPFAFAVLAFAWTLVALYIAANKSQVEVFLTGTTFNSSNQGMAMQFIAGFLTASAILLLFHTLRALVPAARSTNSTSIVTGFALAAGLHFAPDSTMDHIYGLLGNDTKETLMAASEKAKQKDWNALLNKVSWN